METLTGLALFLICAFMFMAGWQASLHYRYKIDHLVRVWRHQLRQAWCALTRNTNRG